jgi:endonuclease/exonuclease/phosphatase (EEP) superfamily protein YafD
MKLSRLLRSCYIAAAIGYSAAFTLYLLLRFVLGDGWWWMAMLNSFVLWGFVPLLILLPFALLLKMPRISLGMIALLMVAVVWYTPRFLPRSIAQAQGDSLRVVTFNMWGGNEELEDVESWLRETDADVVLLQEIVPVYAENTIPALSDIYPYQFFQTIDERFVGNGILSRYPLLESENLWIAGDGLQQRVVIEVGDQRIILYNVHFYMPQTDTPHFYLPIDYPYLNIALLYDDTSRNRQINGMLDVVRDEEGIVIVGGDFNMSDSSIFYDHVASEMTDGFRQAGTGLGLSWPNARRETALPSWTPPVMRIDYVWYRGDVSATNAYMGAQLGSDHLPVAVTLALP